MSTAPMDADLDEVPAPLDPATYARPALPPGVRVLHGVPVRIVERLPEPTLRDRLPFVSSLDA